MNEFIEKLIGRLEELIKHYSSFEEEYFNGKKMGFIDSKIIVNQLAEKYKGKYVSKDEVGYMLDTIEMRGDETWMDYYHKALKELCALSGSEYNNGWIPCSKRLPNKDLWCLVTFESGSVDKIQYLTTNKWGWNGEFADNKVIAWQPLPEPYRKEGRWQQ